MKKNKDAYFKCVTLVEYNNETKDFRILTGDYKHRTCNNFDLLNGAYTFIYGTGDNLYVNNGVLFNNSEMIYVFDKTLTDKIVDYTKNTEYEVYYYIFKLVSSIKLQRDKSNKKLYITSTKKKNVSYRMFSEMLDIPEKGEIKKSSMFFSSGSVIKTAHLKMLELERDNDKYLKNDKDLILDIDVLDIINQISKKIVGQESAITTLVANIYHNQKLISSLMEDSKIDLTELDSRKVAILLDGTTGTGKTTILKEISEQFGLPLVIEVANAFSETGYVGPSITDILVKLLKKADGNQLLAERGIIVLDEIDKIAESDQDSRSMKLGVQEELLGFMSGATYEIKTSDELFSPRVKFDTSKLTFILSGAFTRIKDYKIAEKSKKSLGFGKVEEDDDRTYIVDTDDYIKFGLKKEFFGRIKVITITKTYSIDDLKRILLESEISPLRGFEKSCMMYGYSGIEYTEEFIDCIVSEAYKMGTGARALQSLIQGIQDTMLIDLITNKYDLCKPVNLTEESLNNYQKRKVRKY